MTIHFLVSFNKGEQAVNQQPKHPQNNNSNFNCLHPTDLTIIQMYLLKEHLILCHRTFFNVPHPAQRCISYAYM